MRVDFKLCKPQFGSLQVGRAAGYREPGTATEARAHPLRLSPDIGVRSSGLCEVNADRPVVPAFSDRPSGAAFQVPIRLPLPTEGIVQAKPGAGDVAAVTIHLPPQRRPFCRVPGDAHRCRFCQALARSGLTDLGYFRLSPEAIGGPISPQFGRLPLRAWV